MLVQSDLFSPYNKYVNNTNSMGVMALKIENFGAKIKEARNSKDLTQEQLAEKVGISTVYMGEIERDIKQPSLSVLLDIAEALDVSVDYLLRDTVSSAKVYVNNELTQKLDKLTPKQRKTVIDLVDVYIKSL